MSSAKQEKVIQKNKQLFSNGNASTSTLEKLFFVLSFIYFTIKSLYFSFRIRKNVFPDEATWFGISSLFSRSVWPPLDSPESYSLGLVTHIPNLYFFLMGKLLSLNFLLSSDLVYLRLVNVVLGMLTIYFAWKLVCLLTESSSVRILFLVLLTNTMMYTFIFGSVNYDNLSSLLAVLSLYYLCRFLLRKGTYDLLLFGLFLLAGMSTKNVFLPFAFALILVLFFHVNKSLLSFVWVKSFFSKLSVGKVVLFLLVLLMLGMNINLYVVNKIKYGSLIPRMDQVVSIENCLKNRLFSRNYAANQLKLGKISVLEAQRVALQIREPGDRAFAWTMIEQIKREKKEKETVRMGRLAYSVEWGKYVVARTFGVAAHMALSKNDTELYPYYVILIVAGVLTLVKMGPYPGQWRGALLFVTSFYIIILMQIVNYNNYHSSGFVGLALTGRYLFPVLVPLYILLSDGLMQKMPKWWKLGIGATVGAIFIYGEFPWFLQNVSPRWYF